MITPRCKSDFHENLISCSLSISYPLPQLMKEREDKDQTIVITCMSTSYFCNTRDKDVACSIHDKANILSGH